MKGACWEEHGQCVLQAFQAGWKGLEGVNGNAGGDQNHRLLCQVRIAVPGHGETGCKVRIAEFQVLQRQQRRGFYLGRCARGSQGNNAGPLLNNAGNVGVKRRLA